MIISDYTKEHATGFYKVMTFQKAEEGYDKQDYLDKTNELVSFTEIGNCVENGHVVVLLPVKGLK